MAAVQVSIDSFKWTRVREWVQNFLPAEVAIQESHSESQNDEEGARSYYLARYHILLDEEVFSYLRVREFDMTKQDTRVYFCLHGTGGNIAIMTPLSFQPKKQTHLTRSGGPLLPSPSNKRTPLPDSVRFVL